MSVILGQIIRDAHSVGYESIIADDKPTPGRALFYIRYGENFQRLEGPAADEAALGEAYNDEERMLAMRIHATQVLASGEQGSLQVDHSDEVRITLGNLDGCPTYRQPS